MFATQQGTRQRWFEGCARLNFSKCRESSDEAGAGAQRSQVEATKVRARQG